MKILNLYAGIGGNRKLWGDEHEITAVEYKPEIAAIYHDFFPNDKIVVADAHQYLLEHFREFDFIWSSPPCPTHSKARYSFSVTKNNHGFTKPKPVYPDMTLWQEIIFLKYYFDGKWCVENVVSFYETPLQQSFLAPQRMAGHFFWSSFPMPPYDSRYNYERGHDESEEVLREIKGFDLSKYEVSNKKLLLRNCVQPEVGKHILDWSQKEWHHTKSLLQESGQKAAQIPT